MTEPVDPAVLRALREPDLRGFLDRARDVLEREDGVLRGTVALRGLTIEERAAIARLLGLSRTPGEAVRLPIARLDAEMRKLPGHPGLLEILEGLSGPVRHRREERREFREDQDAMWARAHAHPIVAAEPALGRWLDDLRGTGGLSRLSTAALPASDILAGTLRVLESLGPPRSLDRLASVALGTAHALDWPSPVAKSVVRALAAWSGQEVPSDAEGRRALWAEHGVGTDALSSRVLVVGLRPVGTGLPEAIRTFADAGQPSALTLRLLDSCDFRIADREVWVCENPDLIEAYVAAGVPRATLICTEGMPSIAALVLVRRLAAGGAIVRAHADFDWGGVAIANSVMRASGAKPWRLRAGDYRAALERVGERTTALGPGVRQATWDEDLAPQMAAAGRGVEEEALTDLLLDDLM